MPQQLTNSNEQDTSTLTTILRSVDPQVVGKTFDFVDGQLKALRRSNNIVRAQASSEILTDTPGDFAAMLAQITEETNSVLVPGLWNGDTDGDPFTIVTERELANLTGLAVGAPEFANIIDLPRAGRYSARLKRAIQPSCWLLFDFDRGVAGMPEQWRDLPILEALKLYYPLIPGLKEAAKILYRSSSSRVVGPGRPLGLPSHVWVKVNAPRKIETLMRFLQVVAVINDLAFQSPRYSQTTGEVIGQQWRGLFDWSVMITGRLVFTSKPILTQAAIDAGFSVEPAGIMVVEGGEVDLTSVQMPVASDLAEYHRRTGVALEFRDGNRDGSSLSVHVAGQLSYDTPVVVRGQEQTFGAWLGGMRVGDTLRCEAPFRDSQSEAAFIRCTGPGRGFVYDIGVGETYTMNEADVAQHNVAAVAEVGQALSRRLLGDAATEVNNQRTEQQIERNEAAAELPLIMVDKERPDLAAHAIMPHLSRIEDKPLWDIGGYMVFVDGAKLIDVDRGDERHKVPVLGKVKIGPPHLLEMVPSVVALRQWRGRNLVAAKPSQDIINILLNSVEVKYHLPVLRALAGTPFMRADGSICQQQGYDEATGMWLQTPLDVEVAEQPTLIDAHRALELLRSLLDEVHFADYREDGTVGIDESVALAAMMGVVLRPSFDTCPAVIINGTAAGAGKSYLTKMLGTLATGRDPAMNSWPKRAEELDKTLDAMLLHGVPVIAFDNANAVRVGGDKICSVVSESEISARLLGQTQNLKLSTRGTSLIINGNRVAAKEDFSVRAMTVNLAPIVVVARNIQYRNNPLGDVRANRAKYVEAILTIARSFRVHAPDGSQPLGGCVRVGRWAGFGEWSDCIRSALMWLGCPDPVRSIIEAAADDSDTAGVNALVRAAAAFRPDGSPWKVAEFVAYLTANTALAQEMREAMDPEETRGLQNFGPMVGLWLRDRVEGRPVEVEGGRLVTVKRHRAGTGNNVAKWQVVEIAR